MVRTKIKTRTGRTGQIAHHVLDAVRVLAVATLIVPCIALAQARDGAESFAQGRAAFEREDYATALTSFEAAIAAGVNGPAVHFNVGVAAYKVQRYDRAIAAFEEVARTPTMAPLAHYNLGLVALAQKRDAAARELFERVRTESTDERLRSLAARQLGDTASERAPAWGVFASTGLGYDDNVTLISNGTAVGIARESDIYGDTFAAGSLSFAESWRVDGDVSYLNYADLDDFDQVGLGLAGRYRFTLDDWAADAGAQLSTALLDGKTFEQRRTLFLQGTHSLDALWRLRARYRISSIDGSEDFPGFDGVRHEASVRFNRDGAQWSMSFLYLFELSDFDSASLSALRHLLNADVRRSLTPAWSLRGALSFRHSDYDDPTYGAEKRVELTVGTQRALTQRWNLVLQYVFTDNTADAAEFDYRRNRVFAGVEATF